MRERRLDPLTGEWTTFVNVPPDRLADEGMPCALCPLADDGRVVVVEDVFPPLEPSPPPAVTPAGALCAVAEARGAAELVVYAGGHDQTLARIGGERLEHVIHVWADRYARLGAAAEIGYVLVSEAVGAAAGATSPHPHARIDAFPEIPPRPRRELDVAAAHHAAHGTCVVCDVVALEGRGGRVVTANASFVAFVPFAARFPFEVHVTARRHAASLLDLTDAERTALAEVLHAVLTAYDRLFPFPLPYVLAVRQAPTDDGQWQHVSHFRIELTTPQRSERELKRASVVETAAGATVNDAVPERSAERLRALVAA